MWWNSALIGVVKYVIKCFRCNTIPILKCITELSIAASNKRTRQKSLQNNRLPKFTNAKLPHKVLLAIVSHKIVVPFGCILPKLFQVPDLLTQSFTSYYFPQNCRVIWVHPSKIILSPRFANTKFY